MVGGCSNIMLGRRGLFERCKYWVRDESVKDLSIYKHEKKPSGVFYANQVSQMNLDSKELNNVFMVDENSITLITKGFVSLKKGDIVEFKDKLWFVLNVQYAEINKNQQFMNRPSFETYIAIKR